MKLTIPDGKKAFLLYPDYIRYLRKLSPAERVKWLDTVYAAQNGLEYDDIVATMEEKTEMFWEITLSNFERENQKWDDEKTKSEIEAAERREQNRINKQNQRERDRELTEILKTITMSQVSHVTDGVTNDKQCHTGQKMSQMTSDVISNNVNVKDIVNINTNAKDTVSVPVNVPVSVPVKAAPKESEADAELKKQEIYKTYEDVCDRTVIDLALELSKSKRGFLKYASALLADWKVRQLKTLPQVHDLLRSYGFEIAKSQPGEINQKYTSEQLSNLFSNLDEVEF